ncbi:DUF4149 domain-containing protein [Polynucleobacter sp. AP-Reno-20A-A9]|uniref:DUF4149 domain-containing protein n=1 Tax=Polynucleobacter sp. AP-Reno-20A-A9 TaxID=2576925 RepID=UPI001C0ACB95|nr:DUF4149 domain-containing protein [Polynucleobacter sp. AP-Reno-20A-A9]MBU3628327.1 DUF4149 domain-containing protein [Polynucleobacter sp. AP-Reno-20A-A9]
MPVALSQRLFSLIAGLWVGSFITVGFLVVPVLFTSLGDRQVAGMVAASLFKVTAYLGVVISAFLMMIASRLVKKGNDRFRITRWILLGMLACAVCAAFIIIPWMNSLRDQALYSGLSVRESTNASLFARLHGVSSTIFMIQAVFGLALVWRTTKNAD